MRTGWVGQAQLDLLVLCTNHLKGAGTGIVEVVGDRVISSGDIRPTRG